MHSVKYLNGSFYNPEICIDNSAIIKTTVRRYESRILTKQAVIGNLYVIFWVVYFLFVSLVVQFHVCLCVLSCLSVCFVCMFYLFCLFVFGCLNRELLCSFLCFVYYFLFVYLLVRVFLSVFIYFFMFRIVKILACLLMMKIAQQSITLCLK